MSEQVQTKIAQVNGADLHYIEGGSGDPVIFVHGSQGDYRTWKPQIDAFARQYHVIAYSRRYHYPNEWNGDGLDYTVSLHANDLISLIEVLHLAPTHVVGTSFGAYTTLCAATLRPDLFHKLVIGEPPILPWLRSIPGGQRYWDGFMRKVWEPARLAFAAGDLEQGVRLFIDGITGAEGAFDRLPEDSRRRALDNARELAAETLSPGYFDALDPEQVRELRLPMLLLRGANSPAMFHLIMDQLAQYRPDAQQATIPDASHSMASQNPQVYNDEVLRFLAG